jgi:hypothetical protein
MGTDLTGGFPTAAGPKILTVRGGRGALAPKGRKRLAQLSVPPKEVARDLGVSLPTLTAGYRIRTRLAGGFFALR